MKISKSHGRQANTGSHALVKSPQQIRNEKLQKELDRRLDYVRASISTLSETLNLKLLISEVACRRREFPPPSAITVRRWVHLYCLKGRPMNHGRPLLSSSKERALRLTMIYEE